MTTYRISFINTDGQLTELPVISTSAVQAVADLTTLGFEIRKVTHCFPSV